MQTEENNPLVQKLSRIQNELKAPKGQYNSFGRYAYRSCEDILEAVKPICAKNRTTLTIEDNVQLVGDRYYIEATCELLDWDSNSRIAVSASAREAADKKGMDSAQVTGATSSYARKYALNGLFNIDDTKDSDTDEYHNATTQKVAKKATGTRTKTQQATQSAAKAQQVQQTNESYKMTSSWDDKFEKIKSIYRNEFFRDKVMKYVVTQQMGKTKLNELTNAEMDQIIEMYEAGPHTWEDFANQRRANNG